MRCSMSKLVIGSPLTTTTAFWASACGTAIGARQIASAASAALERSERGGIENIHEPIIVSTAAAARALRVRRRSRWCRERLLESEQRRASRTTRCTWRGALVERRRSNGAQADLQHHAVIGDRI